MTIYLYETIYCIIIESGTAKATATANISSSSYKTYSGSKHVLDFSTVTGISGTKDAQRFGTFKYSNVSKSSIDKYTSALLNAGFKKAGEKIPATPWGNTTQEGYYYGTAGVSLESTMIVEYYATSNGYSVTVIVNPEYSLSDSLAQVYGSN